MKLYLRAIDFHPNSASIKFGTSTQRVLYLFLYIGGRNERLELYFVDDAGHSAQLLYRGVGENFLEFEVDGSFECYAAVLDTDLNVLARNADMTLQCLNSTAGDLRIGALPEQLNLKIISYGFHSIYAFGGLFGGIQFPKTGNESR